MLNFQFIQIPLIVLWLLLRFNVANDLHIIVTAIVKVPNYSNNERMIHNSSE